MPYYENLNQIIVCSQEEMDEVPLMFDGKIYVGTEPNSYIYVGWRYLHPVTVFGGSTVIAWRDAHIKAVGDSHIVAKDCTVVEATQFSQIVAFGESTIIASQNSEIEAWDYATVDKGGASKVQLHGCARIIQFPKTIEKFMDFYEIKHNRRMAVFYKAVHKKGETYFSDYSPSLCFAVGQKVKAACDPDVNHTLSYGVYISNLNYALNYGKNWEDLAILEVETDIKNIVLPNSSDGEARTSEIKVLREIPLNSCGLYGQFLNKNLKERTL